MTARRRMAVRLVALSPPLLACLCGAAPRRSRQPEVTLRVDAAKVLNRITPWMTGACIEDVNHEIYGGLYAQMLFGESFEEPPRFRLRGWTAYGGQWSVRDGALAVAPEAGAKLVRDAPTVRDGRVECDVRLADSRGDNAGLILRVNDARTGADAWTGYEVSLSAVRHELVVGRHRNDWHLLRTAPAPVEAGRWRRLRVDLDGPRLRVYVDGAGPLVDLTDTETPILSGRVGVRTWQSAAQFRNLRVEADGRTAMDPLDARHLPADAGTGQVSGMWDPLRTGHAAARYGWDAADPFNTARSQRITLFGHAGTAGIANRGLNRWGLTVRAGHRYAGHLYLRQRGYRGRVTVALQSADGARTYARQSVGPVGAVWRRYDFSLRPSATDTNARFAVWIDRPGTVWVDEAYLSPTNGGLFRGQPERADIGNGLVAEGLTFLRYGGSMVNAKGYRWKKMVGPRDRRPQYKGTWYPYSTNGFGIEEFVAFCRATNSPHIEPAFAINIEETPRDAAELVEYLNGPASSPWGRRRAAAGHPAPYGVRYVEIGNEEAIDGSKAWYQRYLERFKLLEPAMHRADPKLHLVIAAWWRPDEPWCRRIVQELNGKAALWDLHVGGDGLRDGPAAEAELARMRLRFQEWAPGTSLRACVFEENGGRHDLQRALGHARILNATSRLGDFVRMDCPANCLQPWKQNDNGWDQGQLFFTSGQVWGMPPYFAQQMAARNYLPLHVASTVEGAAPDLDVLATRSEDGRTLALKVVNASAAPVRATLRLDGFAPAPQAEAWTLSGALTDVNTPDAPARIRPRHESFAVAGPSFARDFPAYSYTVLRLRRP